MGFQTEIINYVKQQPFEITDWMIDGPFTKEEDRINGTVEKLISVRPTKITNVIGNVQPYGEEKIPGCVFRRIVTTHSAGNCPPIPLHCDHPFRNIVTTDSAGL